MGRVEKQLTPLLLEQPFRLKKVALGPCISEWGWGHLPHVRTAYGHYPALHSPRLSGPALPEPEESRGLPVIPRPAGNGAFSLVTASQGALGSGNAVAGRAPRTRLHAPM